MELQENKEKNMSKFSENLKNMMKEKNLPAGKLADMVGVTPQTFMSWLDGTKAPYTGVVPALCKALECKESELGLKPSKDISSAEESKEEKVAVTPEPVMPEPAKPEAAKQETPKQDIGKITEDKVSTKPVKEVKDTKKPAPAKTTEPGLTVGELSKTLTALPKPLPKSADAPTQAFWVNELALSISQNILKLADAWPVDTGVQSKFKKLLDAAQNASDESIELAIAVLKRCK